jgi:hypothetical protein
MGQGVGCFRNDNPGGEVDEGSDAGEDGEKDGKDPDQRDVPVVVLGEAGADAGDHARVARADEGAGDVAGRGRCGGGGDAGSAVGAEAGVEVEGVSTARAEHTVLSSSWVSPALGEWSSEKYTAKGEGKFHLSQAEFRFGLKANLLLFA